MAHTFHTSLTIAYHIYKHRSHVPQIRIQHGHLHDMLYDLPLSYLSLHHFPDHVLPTSRLQIQIVRWRRSGVGCNRLQQLTLVDVTDCQTLSDTHGQKLRTPTFHGRVDDQSEARLQKSSSNHNADFIERW